MLLDDHDNYHIPLAEIDQDTGCPISRPTNDLFRQVFASTQRNIPSVPSSLVLKSYFHLESNTQYFQPTSYIPLTAIPKQGYCWTIIPYPSTNQLALGRVYTRDPATKEIYVQYYQVAVKPIDSYRLKHSRRNLDFKGSHKYNCTTDTSAIVKYQGCYLHDAHQLLAANQRAYRNNHSPPTCIFKQSDELAHLLPIKSHQLYQDIILLKHHLNDLLPHYDCHTNISSQQI